MISSVSIFPYLIYGYPYEDHSKHQRHTCQELKREAARRGETMSDLVEAALRLFLREPSSNVELPPLPVLESGGSRVDIANRQSLYDVMD